MVLFACLKVGHLEAKETKTTSMLCIPKDAEHSRCLVPYQAPHGHGAMRGLQEQSSDRTSLPQGGTQGLQHPSLQPRTSWGGSEATTAAQSSDMGIGMGATEGAPTANLLLSQSHAAEQASSSPSRIDGDPSHPAQSYRQGLSPLLTSLTRRLSCPQGCYTRLVRQQDAPLAHGLLVHLSTFFSQLEPVKLGGHSQA